MSGRRLEPGVYATWDGTQGQYRIRATTTRIMVEWRRAKGDRWTSAYPAEIEAEAITGLLGVVVTLGAQAGWKPLGPGK